MVQLSHDCFTQGAPLLRLEEAIALLRARLPVLAGVEEIGLRGAAGRIAAADHVARSAVPPFANSAVDGYAVRSADLSASGETTLPLAGRLAAGAQPAALAAGCAVRIFTGAPVPEGADLVVMQEDVDFRDGVVVLPLGLSPGANLRRAGEDVARGARIIVAGQRLRPQDLALAAASGHARLAVRRPLRVALFSTGDELVEPGDVRPPGSIYDSNRVMLAALLARTGAEVVDCGIVRDRPKALRARLEAAARTCDLVLCSGGVSVGDEDHVRAAVAASGSIEFWRLAIRPGRPVAVGVVAGVPFAGLPGNPVAAFVTFSFVVAPMIEQLSGAAACLPRPLPVRSGFAMAKKTGRREFVRVQLRAGPDGAPEAVRFGREGSALLSSLAGSDGLVALDEDRAAVGAGDLLDYYPFG